MPSLARARGITVRTLPAHARRSPADGRRAAGSGRYAPRPASGRWSGCRTRRAPARRARSPRERGRRPGAGPELLGGLLPLAAGARLAVEWRVLFGPRAAAVAAALHPGLRGGESAIEAEDWAAYRRLRAHRPSAETARAIVLHDAGASAWPPALDAPAVWRCHVDASRAEGEALARVGARGALPAMLVPHESFCPPTTLGVPSGTAACRPPRPGSTRSTRATSTSSRGCRAGWCGRWAWTSTGRSASRCWSSTAGTTRMPRSRRSGSPRPRSPTSSSCSPGCSTGRARRAGGRRRRCPITRPARTDVLLLTTYEGLGSLEVGALQRLARAALELSLREGFDLAPCETLWKRTPVVGGGPRFTVRDGVDGFLAADAEQAAARLVELVRDPGLAVEMGRAGRERVRERFLVTAALERELRALRRLASQSPHEGHAPRRLPARAPRRRHRRRRRRARSARAWPAPRSACAQNGDLRDLDAPLAEGARRDRHRQGPGRALADPPRRRPRARHRRHGALPRREDLDRPADRRRLLLRLRVPRGGDGLRRRLRAHRGQDARAHQGRRALRARRTSRSAEAIERFRARARTTRSS